MRAVVLPEFGAELAVTQLEIPEPGQGEVRIRVHAASVNGFDVAVANGYLKDLMEHRFPVVIGKDFAGTVDAIGSGVRDFKPGERVFGVVTKPFLGDGSFGEYVVVPAAVGLAPLPDGIGFSTAAGLGLAGAAAAAAVDAAGLHAGRTVLVSGATGGVGHLAVQLAVATGAAVVATAASDEERQLVSDLGAASTVDYREDVAGAVRDLHPDGVDAIIHLAGDPAGLLAAVRDGGLFVSTLLQSPEQLPADRVTVVGIYANPDRTTLDRLTASVVAGTRLEVQRTYSVDEATAALADFGGGTLGKLVILFD